MATFLHNRLLLLVIALMSIILLGDAIPSKVSSAPTEGENRNQAVTPYPKSQLESEPGEINAISIIQSNSPSCLLPVPRTGTCYIKWGEISVSTTDGSYINYLYIKINNKGVAYHRGFFQQYMNIPSEMYGSGFRVTCGFPGAGGTPDFGNIYTYEIRAADTSGATTANFGSVLCPADIVNIYLPAVRR